MARMTSSKCETPDILPAYPEGTPATVQIVRDFLLLMDACMVGKHFELYAGYGMGLDIIRKRLAGSSGTPENTREWAQGAKRTE